MILLTEMPAEACDRKEFGFKRTVCGCQECSRNCLFIPGYLIPADLQRLLPTDASKSEWAEKYLRASPGGLVLYQGKAFRIPTIVPARKDNGSCVFHSEGNCTVHRVSPFGCAFFDNHMSDEEGDIRTRMGLASILEGFQSGYGELWRHLWEKNLRVPGPEESRARMERAAA